MYFEEEPNGCPCSTCKPPNTDPNKDPVIHTRQALDVNARQVANQTKRARQAENRKKAEIMRVGVGEMQSSDKD